MIASDHSWKPVAVGEGHAEQLADDVDGQRGGEVLDQVGGGAVLLHVVEQLVGDLLGARAQLSRRGGR